MYFFVYLYYDLSLLILFFYYNFIILNFKLGQNMIK